MELVSLIAIAVVAFASTNIDDLFVLLGFFADPDFDRRDIVLGQCLGIAALFGASVIVSLLALAIPVEYLRFLGLGPVLVGIRKWLHLRRDRRDAASTTRVRDRNRFGWLTVATVTIANGGDNIGVYAPLFAARAAPTLLIFAGVFAAMTLAWCGFGHWLVGHPTFGAPLRRHGPRMVPWVLIAIGAWILLGAG